MSIQKRVIATNILDGTKQEFTSLAKAGQALQMSPSTVANYARNNVSIRDMRFAIIEGETAVPVKVVVTFVNENNKVCEYESMILACKTLHMHRETINKYATTPNTVFNGKKFKVIKQGANEEIINVPIVLATIDITPTTPVLPPQSVLEFIFPQAAGIFAGKKVRTTDDVPPRVSVYDLISVVTGVVEPYHTWNTLCEQHPSVLQNIQLYQFPGARQRETPVTDAAGLVEIVNLLPGHAAAQFRAFGSNLIVRYLAGDRTLMNEISKIDDMYTQHENTGFFRQANLTNQIVAHHVPIPVAQPENPFAIMSPRLHGKSLYDFIDKQVCYLIGFNHDAKSYIKFGSTMDAAERMTDHLLSNVKCLPKGAFLWSLVDSDDCRKLEKEFKKWMRYNGHLTDLTIEGRKLVEIIHNIDPKDAEYRMFELKESCRVEQDACKIKLAEIELAKTRCAVQQNMIQLLKATLETKPELCPDMIKMATGILSN